MKKHLVSISSPEVEDVHRNVPSGSIWMRSPKQVAFQWDDLDEALTFAEQLRDQLIELEAEERKEKEEQLREELKAVEA